MQEYQTYKKFAFEMRNNQNIAILFSVIHIDRLRSYYFPRKVNFISSYSFRLVSTLEQIDVSFNVIFYFSPQ